MATPLEPRACAAHAWKSWWRDGVALTRRAGWPWLLPVVIFSNAMIVASLNHPLFLMAMAAGGGVMMGLNVAVADTLALGRVSIADVWDTAWNDLKNNARFYARNALWRLTIALVVVGGDASVLFETANPLVGKSGIHPSLLLLYVFNLIAFQIYLVGQMLRLGGPIGFFPWLSWKTNMPFVVAWRLNSRAHTLNLMNLMALVVSMILAGVIAILAAPLLPIVGFFWVAALRGAYVDIFNTGERLRDVARAPASMPARLAGALAS